MKNKITLKWLRKIIAENKVILFYSTSVWCKLRREVLKEFHYECQHCKQKGIHTQATTVHHIKPLRKYPELALNKTNLIPLCDSCHYDEHHRNRKIKPKGFFNEEKW